MRKFKAVLITFLLILAIFVSVNTFAEEKVEIKSFQIGETFLFYQDDDVPVLED